MSASRMIIFIVVTIYLVGLGFLIPAINKDINQNKITYDSTGKAISTGTQQFNFITSITSLPIWFNIIAIVIPFIIWGLLLITFFLPTTNAGQ